MESTNDNGTELSLSQLSLDIPERHVDKEQTSQNDNVPSSIPPSPSILSSSISQQPILICDAGYGFPREARPRKEKILAIARQLVNFLQWQQETNGRLGSSMAQVRVVSCPDEAIREALQDRTLHLLGESDLPPHLSFSCDSLEKTCRDSTMGGGSTGGDDNDDNDDVIYLSPDAKESLDPSQKPPRVVVVGLLIDRRIQRNRSNDRACQLEIVTKRWPLESFFQEISANEPLNVDCVLEGMQQWWWNSDNLLQQMDHVEAHKEAFVQAASQAIHHHAERHPSRPVHLTS